MSGFISWVMSILAIVVVGTVLDMFLSEKKLGKMVRGVFASLVVLVIISPLPSLMNGCEGLSGSFIPTELKLDSSYLDYANSQKCAALEKGLQSALSDKGYSGVVAEITAEFEGGVSVTMVKLNINGLVIEKGALNINKKEKLRELTAEYLKINKDTVILVD